MSELAHSVIIAVDGGGTGCRAAIGTPSDGILARAEGGAANATSDPELAIRNITDTVSAAAQRAGVTADALTGAVAHLGLAGVMTPEDSARIAAALPFRNAVVTDDCPTTVAGALGAQDGCLLAVGTGSIAARKVGDAVTSVGGWGFHVSDQASGAWLGRAGLQQVLLCHDGLVDHTAATRALFAEFDGDPNAIVAFSMSAAPGDYGAFAPVIVSCAADGDVWARATLTSGAAYLVQSLKALGFRAGDALCLTGGLGPQYAPYLPPDLLANRVDRLGSALDGAFQLARSRVAQTVVAS